MLGYESHAAAEAEAEAVIPTVKIIVGLLVVASAAMTTQLVPCMALWVVGAAITVWGVCDLPEWF